MEKKTFHKNIYHNEKIIIDHFETLPINNINKKITNRLLYN